MTDARSDPHAHQPELKAGPPPEQADAVVVLLHGRGGDARDMLSLFKELALPSIAAVAPQAAGRSWYPLSFLAPLDSNQPYLDSALRRVETIASDLLAKGIPAGRIALLGFSQGACLTAEFTARHPRPYGAIMALTGGLVGPPGTPREYPGSLAGVPVFLGTSDPDPHVPFERVQETAQVFTRMGAVIDLRRYPGMSHTINGDEVEACRALLQGLSHRNGVAR